MANHICIIRDCKNKPIPDKNICEEHYKQLEDKIRLTNTHSCAVRGCEAVHHGLGLCRRHYDHFRKYRNLYRKYRPIPIRLCEVPGCDQKHRGLGMCSKHYSLFINRKRRDSRNCTH